MDNPETLATQGTQDTSRGQQTLENTQGAIRNGHPETLATQGTQETSQGKRTLENTQGAIRNGQS